MDETKRSDSERLLRDIAARLKRHAAANTLAAELAAVDDTTQAGDIIRAAADAGLLDWPGGIRELAAFYGGAGEHPLGYPNTGQATRTLTGDNLLADVATLAARQHPELFGGFPLEAVTVAKYGLLPNVKSRSNADAATVCEMAADRIEANKFEAVYLGNRQYQVGDEPPLVLQESEDHVLRSLIDLPNSAGSLTDLRNQTGKGDCARVLKAIKRKRKYKGLAPFIFLPGGKAKGGYRTTIRRANVAAM